MAEVVGGVTAELMLDISQFKSAITEATREAEKLSSGLNIKPNNGLDSSIKETKTLIDGLTKTVQGMTDAFKSGTNSIVGDMNKVNSAIEKTSTVGKQWQIILIIVIKRCQNL